MADIPDLKSGAGCPGVWVRLPLPTPLSNYWTLGAASASQGKRVQVLHSHYEGEEQ